ncbi:MAG: phage major capsid protein [Spirochaetaceae bacterium]|nr:phage major capsid protein [Spirochaetaceae bacterium]
MTTTQRLQLRLSEIRQKLNELSAKDELTDGEQDEMRSLTAEYPKLEERHRAALVAEDADEQRAAEDTGDQMDTEQRERIDLRSKAQLTGYLERFLRGKRTDGAEAELQAAAGVSDAGIPIELWDVPTEQRNVEERAITPAPGTVGVNLDPIRPAVFANSIAPRLGIDMPRVASGTYATGTISTSQTAAAKAKSAAIDATAGAITVATATPKRVSARLELTLEDVAAVGQANFESMLRQNLSLALSDALDAQAINGDGNAPNLTGIFQRLTDPSAPAAGVADFDAFVELFTAGIDGLWANTDKDVAIVAGVETYRLSARTFRDETGQDLGDIAFSDYAMERYGGWWTDKRMPAKASHVQQAILYRKGRSMAGGSRGMRTAVCPHWGEVGIDDVYTGSAKAERYFTLHVLLGDVILVQPDAYAQVAVRVST